MDIITNNEGNFKISDNKVFLLKLPNPNSIYIKKSEIENVKNSNPDFFNFLEQQRTSKRLSEDSIYYNYEKFTIKKDYEIKGEKNDCIHAEVDCVKSLKKCEKITPLNIVVFRTNNKGDKLMMAKPCENCLKTIDFTLKKKNYKLKKLMFSNENSEFCRLQ